MKRPSKRFIVAAFVVSSLVVFAAVGVSLSIWYGAADAETKSSLHQKIDGLQQTRAFTAVSGWLGHDVNATSSESDQDDATEEQAASSNHQRSNLQQNHHRSNILAASSNRQRQQSNHRNNRQNHRNNQQNHRPNNQQNHHQSNNNNQRNHHRSLQSSYTNRDIIGSRAYFRTDTNARFEHGWSDGAPTHPCQEGAIFRRYVFTARDNGKLIKIVPTGNPAFPLKVMVDGFVRTLATATKFDVAGDLRDLPLNTPFSLCGIETDNYLDSDANSFVGVANNDANSLVEVATAECTQLYFNDQSNTDKAGNKDIVFDMFTASPHHYIILQAEEDPNEVLVPTNEGQYSALGRSPAVQGIILTKEVNTPICSALGLTGNPTLEPVVFLLWGGAFWMHDPRFALRENMTRNHTNNGKETHSVSYRAMLAFIVLISMVLVV